MANVLQRVRARYIYGVTATPIRGDGLERVNHMLMGPIRYRYTSKQRAQAQGIRHLVYPRFTRTVNPYKYGEKTHPNDAYELLRNNDVRDQQIIGDIKQCVANGRTPVVLTKYTEHAERLHEQLKNAADHVFLYLGTMKQREQKQLRAELLTVAPEESLILIATGRQPNVEGLGLERAGIDFSKRGIQVDDNFQTNVPGIYAIGDVNAKCMLAHAAEFQGFHVVNHILGKPGNIRHEVMPSAIFTHPEAASVGMTEDQCKEQGIAAVCKKAFFRANGKALAMNETEGLLKLIAREDGRILGCHAYGAHAADLVQEVSVLICRDTTIDELKDMVHIHPTLSEIVHDAAMNF